MKARAYVGLLFCLACSAHAAESQYLFIWTADADEQDSDFVAVLDANPASESYGDVLRTVEVGYPARAHHSEHRMPEDDQLFVNGYSSGRSYVIDLSDPLDPKLAASFTSIDQYSYPHSFERLPNGNVLATFQNALGETESTGGIVELTPRGEFVRSASAVVEGMPEIRPYSLVPRPDDDLVVTTASDMEEIVVADSLQFWRLSDLKLLNTIRLPPGPRGNEHEHPAEPRMMDDGETMLVNTFSCGLYRVSGATTENPTAEYLYTFEMADIEEVPSTCAFAVTFGPYWVQTVPTREGLVTLDMSYPAKPKETSFLHLGAGVWPHWVVLEPEGNRIVLTGYGAMENQVMMLQANFETGEISIDRRFGENGVANFSGPSWPHGETGAAVPHGSVFSNP